MIKSEQSEESTSPVTLSIIMPVYNGAPYLERSIAALRQSWSAQYELIIVDDASTDNSAELAENLIAGIPRARLLQLTNNTGPAEARNAAARSARGDFLLFIDADVAVHADTLQRITNTFAPDDHLAAVFGSYDSDPAAPGIVSRFRNLLHHHIHQEGQGEARTFWTGCGAVRRAAFLAVGPLRTASITCMEDVDYGHRLHDAGYRIRLDPRIQCRHLKPWTLLDMVQTDIFRRAVPWTIMMKRRGQHDGVLNVTRRERISAPAAIATLLFASAAAASPALARYSNLSAAPIASASGLIAAAALVTLGITQRKFYRLLYKTGGIPLATSGPPPCISSTISPPSPDGSSATASYCFPKTAKSDSLTPEKSPETHATPCAARHSFYAKSPLKIEIHHD